MYDMAVNIVHTKRCRLAQFHTYATGSKVGRKKQWTERLTLPLAKETVERLDAVLAEGEARLDLIRDGIERELKRREKASKSGF